MAKGDFIPEYIMYALIGKAKNEKATQFMLWVGQVLTEIRATGKYDNKEHEIMQIEDEEERRLTLAVHRLQQVYEIDKDEFTALRLENKQLQLDRYKDSKKRKCSRIVYKPLDASLKKAYGSFQTGSFVPWRFAKPPFRQSRNRHKASEKKGKER